MVRIPKPNQKLVDELKKASMERDADMKARYEGMSDKQKDYLREICDE